MSPDEEGLISGSLNQVLLKYSKSFSGKAFFDEFDEEDDLMLVFGLTQTIKASNKQYWGRELGMCWQLLITELCRQTRSDFSGSIKHGEDEPCDLTLGEVAIDTKYRIGSGDSGTLKKFRQNAALLEGLGYKPTLLILRKDNLPAAINSCKRGGWQVLVAADTYQYILEATGFDLEVWLKSRKNLYRLPAS